jgi:hypothetical protein
VPIRGISFPGYLGSVSHADLCLSEVSTVPAANSIHQSSTDAAEVVGHAISGNDGLALLVFGEFVFTPDMDCRGLIDHEIGRESGGMDLVIIGAMADEGS